MLVSNNGCDRPPIIGDGPQRHNPRHAAFFDAYRHRGPCGRLKRVLDQQAFIPQEEARMMFRHLLLASLLLVGMAPFAIAQDPVAHWPQWRGPLWTGVSPQGDPP